MSWGNSCDLRQNKGRHVDIQFLTSSLTALADNIWYWWSDTILHVWFHSQWRHPGVTGYVEFDNEHWWKQYRTMEDSNDILLFEVYAVIVAILIGVKLGDIAKLLNYLYWVDSRAFIFDKMLERTQLFDISLPVALLDAWLWFLPEWRWCDMLICSDLHQVLVLS